MGKTAAAGRHGAFLRRRRGTLAQDAGRTPAEFGVDAVGGSSSADGGSR